MAIFGSAVRDRGIAVQEVAQIERDPQTNQQVNRAIAQSVQEFPPAINTGAFFAQTVRGNILPPFGTKERDRVLRLYHRNEYNLLWQGAVSGLVKKIKSTPWEISGPPQMVEYYQTLLQFAHFGQGWGSFLSRFIEDYLTQDFGGVVELIGAGDPMGPIEGPITGVAHLDAGRCFITGNPYYPLMYFSLISGSLHRMHASRVYRMVDNPSPDERYFGLGLCALSRAISVVNRQLYSTRYIEGRLDDKPQPGVMVWNGLLEQQFNAVMGKYSEQQQNDERPVWGKTIHLFSVNLDNPIKAESTTFAQTPEKFDWVQYNSLDVNAIALALGVDRQELWELEGRSLGSGAQSEILHQKAQGKTFGDLLQGLERFLNICVLPEDCEFKFKSRDDEADAAEADLNSKNSTSVAGLVSGGILRTNEARSFLANSNEKFKDVLTNEQGTVELPDVDRINPQSVQREDVSLEDDNPIQVNSPQAQQNQNAAPTQTDTKAFSITSADFTRQFVNVVNRALTGRMNRDLFESWMLGILSTAGTNAYIDGLREGGVLEGPDADEQAEIQDMLVDQIDYIDGFANEVYTDPTLVSQTVRARGAMWVNKTLRQFFDAGRLASDSSALYEFTGHDGEESCPDCQRLSGQVHRMKDWTTKEMRPGVDTHNFKCKGFQCKHRLTKVFNVKEKGSW